MLDVLERYYSLVLTDCGTGLMHSAMSAVLANASIAAMDIADGGAGPIEIGSLLWLVYQTGIVLDGDDFQRLKSFRSLRNDLAHRTPVPDTRLSQIRAYLAFS